MVPFLKQRDSGNFYICFPLYVVVYTTSFHLRLVGPLKTNCIPADSRHCSGNLEWTHTSYKGALLSVLCLPNLPSQFILPINPVARYCHFHYFSDPGLGYYYTPIATCFPLQPCFKSESFYVPLSITLYPKVNFKTAADYEHCTV